MRVQVGSKNLEKIKRNFKFYLESDRFKNVKEEISIIWKKLTSFQIAPILKYDGSSLTPDCSKYIFFNF